MAEVNGLSLAIVILATGDESRMKSRRPKALHMVGGKPLLSYAIAMAATIVAPHDIFVFLGYEAEQIKTALDSTGAHFVVTGEMPELESEILLAREVISGYDTVLVLPGDQPLLQTETLSTLLKQHASGATMTRLTIRSVDERKSLGEEPNAFREINTGVFVSETKALMPHLYRLTTTDDEGLDELAQGLLRAGEAVNSVMCVDAAEAQKADTIAELIAIDSALRMRTALRLMEDGVTIYRPETCVIDADVEVGLDTVIEPNVQLLGKTRIGSDCLIRSGSVIENSTLADGVLIRQSCIVTDSIVETGATIGPFAHLRPGSEIGEDAHIGNFVETKKARIGKGAKAGHLSYLGDAEVGAGTNIGAGVITCNYDGVRKHTTKIGEGAFVGSDSTLVAPVTIGEGAYIGAGSCITKEVPAGALAVARTQQVIKEGWVEEKRKRQDGTC